MNISRFFIDRPIFAGVLSIVIFVAGAIAIPLLPISEYPEVVPPQVQVRAVYPGANPKTIADTVAAPLEQAINGVERMMYMKSVASSDGAMTLSVTFRPGTDPDSAQVWVQNRVSQALARLPEEVRRQGVVTEKQSANITLVIHLLSPDARYDSLYLRNYAHLHVLDEIKRIDGVGLTNILGSGEYAMRVWLDPGKITARGLTASEVVQAIREQNVQVSAGQLGAPPTSAPTDFLLSINVAGRLVTEEEFRQIVVHTGENGELTRLSDVARVELGASTYSLRALLDNKQAVGIGIFQSPGSNVIELSHKIRARMNELSKAFPEGMKYEIDYDPTVFVEDSIKSVVETLFEAALLVVLVVVLFLQTWRASVIPLIAVPVSIVGTFGVLLALGFTINTLTLFGLVLAIGIVVDDAIVVVENVERNIEAGLDPKAAAHQAMKEVSSPIVAVALVLCAVFVPMVFMPGLTGQFFKQFAATIAISTVISAINSLTLSPALAARLLKPHGASKDWLTRGIDLMFGWGFKLFNKGFQRTAHRYSGAVGRAVHHRGVAFAVYAVAVAAAAFMFTRVPGGFVPTQDKMYLVSMVSMPPGASLDRTEQVVKEMTKLALETDGVSHAIQFPGLNAVHFTNTPSSATTFITLTNPDERKHTADEIVAELNRKLSTIKEGVAFAFMPPPILGLGTGAGFSLYLEDRGDQGVSALAGSLNDLQGSIAGVPGLGMPFSTFQPNVPQLDVNIDRVRAKAQGVPLSNLFDTLQIYLGSAYVNDFTRFGRTYQVVAQADAPFRAQVEQLRELRTRNSAGQLV
ncbi:MAG TPA: efflux RND transporter permease subunit, partial [Myxococcales bacterium]|nr:efflux RND transporter permease subunit [Myxococcales bacterium]